MINVLATLGPRTGVLAWSLSPQRFRPDSLRALFLCGCTSVPKGLSLRVVTFPCIFVTISGPKPECVSGLLLQSLADPHEAARDIFVAAQYGGPDKKQSTDLRDASTEPICPFVVTWTGISVAISSPALEPPCSSYHKRDY